MAVGKQNETVIVHWYPGEATGNNGLGVGSATIPTEGSAEASYADAVLASGLRYTNDAIATEVTSRTAVNTRVSTLSTRIVASGVLPTGV